MGLVLNKFRAYCLFVVSVFGSIAVARAAADTAQIMFLSTAAQNAVQTSLAALYPDRIVNTDRGFSLALNRANAVIIADIGDFSGDPLEELVDFARRGGTAIVDLSVYAQLRSLELLDDVGTEAPGLIVTQENSVTRGLAVSDPLPWYRPEGPHYAQRRLLGAKTTEILAESTRGGALIVLETHGEGKFLATDLLGLDEPHWKEPGAFNKYLFLGNALGQTVKYGRYYPERFSYDEFVVRMRELAEGSEWIRVRDEGGAYGDRRIYSLILGDTDKPAFLAYAAVHGGEWEPAFGLLRLAEILAQAPDGELFDFERYHLVLVPIFNPSGYDANQRRSLSGVDLNRPYQQSVDEPEIQTFKAMLDRIRPRAVLDLHGNAGGDGFNRLIVLARALPKTQGTDVAFAYEVPARHAAALFNAAVKDRYVLHESRRSGVEQFSIESVWNDEGALRTMGDYAAEQGIPGFLVELPAMYPNTYGLIFITDLTVEIFHAFYHAYAQWEAGAYPSSSGIAPVALDKKRLSYHGNVLSSKSNSYPLRVQQFGRSGQAEFLLYANGGDRVNVVAQQRSSSRQDNEQAVYMTVTAPDGSETLRENMSSGQQTELGFVAPASGVYTLSLPLAANRSVQIARSSHPVNLNLESGRIMLRDGAGDYAFHVPSGVTEFAIRINGVRNSAFNARLLDSRGEEYGESTDAFIREYWVKLDSPEDAGIWTLQIRNARSIGKGNAIFIEMLGVPPLLAAAPEQLLVE